MLQKIIRFSIQNKLIIGIFLIALISWGVYSVQHLPIDALPDITNNQVQVITVSPSNSAEDIERFVTFPVEQTMATIPGIQEIRSFSRFGLSVVTIVFGDNIDVYWARQQVNERLSNAQTQIPSGMGAPFIAPLTTGLGEIYQYVLHVKPGYEKQYTAMDLRTIQDWIVRRQLLGVEGVADVSSFGGYLKQYEIALNPVRLKSMNLSITDVFKALQKNNQNTGGAYIDKKPNAYFIHSYGLVGSLSDIENIVVTNLSNGTPVLIKDIGKAQLGYATRYGAMTRNDEGEVTGAVVMMLKDANASQVIERVKTRISEIEQNLPKGVVIEPYLDRTKLVNRAISTVTRNLIEGALIVIFVLVLFLGNIRAGLIVASVIPLSMLFAITLMNFFGVSGNLMSLGAIDFGLIVDGAVIIVEAIMHDLGMRKFTQKLTQKEMDKEVETAATRMLSSSSFGTIIILIVYLPILALVGIEGKMFKPMAQTVTFAILGAFILSLTYVPMISSLFLSKNPKHNKTISDRLMNALHSVYEPVLKWVLHHRIIIFTAMVAILAGSVLLFNTMGSEFIPQLDEGDFAVETRILPGSSLSKTIDVVSQSAKVLKQNFPEVIDVIGKIGSSEIPIDPMPVEASDMIIMLKDKKEWVSASSREALADTMQKVLEASIPGVTYGFQQPIQMRFNELIAGARQDVVIKIFGEDLSLLSDYANKVGRIAGTVQGAADIYVEQVTGLPQIVVNFKREAIAKYGLNIEDINQIIRAGFAGDAAGLVFEGEKRFDLVVRLDTLHRESIDDLRNLYIPTPSGSQVPLQELADVNLIVGPNQIQREDTKRRITVGFNVRGRDVESIVNELQQKVAQQIKFAPGYSITYGGSFENLQAAKSRLSIAVPVALLLIFLLLYFAFNSIKQGLLIFTAIPLSAVGGILALWLRGMPFSISAGVGFIALFGVAVLNGIVLISECNRLQKEGMNNIETIILTATSSRLRPIMITATVASLGFIPMALSTGSGAEVQRPLATVVIGGLITATILTLLVLPALYKTFTKIKQPPAVVFIALLLLCSTGSLKAQTVSYTREQAIQTALANNKNLQAISLDVASQKALRGTSSDIGKTNITLLYGQYNSLNSTDNNFTVLQTVPFPTVFSKKAALNDAMVQGKEYEWQFNSKQLEYNIKMAWNELLYTYALERLLMKQDSLFSAFQKAADLRYKTGETNLLEKTTVETQHNEIKNQLMQVLSNRKAIQYRLQGFMQIAPPALIVPADTSWLVLSLPNLTDSSTFHHHPFALYWQQQIQIANANKKVYAAQKAPDITVGYFNQSLIGYQNVNGQDKYFDGSKRFDGLHAGLSIPLWIKPYQAKVKSAEIEAKAAEARYQSSVTVLQTQYQEAIQNYLKNKASLNYYTSSALQNAALITQQAQQAFQKGETDFVAYLLALNNALSIQQNYILSIFNYNNNIISIEYLLAQ